MVGQGYPRNFFQGLQICTFRRSSQWFLQITQLHNGLRSILFESELLQNRESYYSKPRGSSPTSRCPSLIKCREACSDGARGESCAWLRKLFGILPSCSGCRVLAHKPLHGSHTAHHEEGMTMRELTVNESNSVSQKPQPAKGMARGHFQFSGIPA